MKLEQVADLLDIVGMVPGFGEVADLGNIIPKSILAYRYSFGPKKNEKFNFPFDLGTIDMSTFYYIDLMISLLSAFTIGEPLKLVKLAIQKGGATVKDIFVFSDFSLKILQPFLVEGKPQTVLYRIFRVLGMGNKAEINEYLEKTTETLMRLKEGAEKIQNARKFVNFKKAEELMSRTSQLGGYEAFEFLMGGGLLGKIIPGANKVKNTDEYVKTIDNLTDAILLRKAEQISKTAIKITNPKRFDNFLEVVSGSENLTDEAIKNLKKLDKKTKLSLGYIIEKINKNNVPLDQIRDDIITPLAAAAKEGVSEKKKLEAFISELIKVVNKNNDVFDGQMIPMLKEIDWSNGLNGVSDYYKNLALKRFKTGELALAAKSIVGESDVVKSAIVKANNEIAESLDVIKKIKTNPRFLETATPGVIAAFKRIDGLDWMSKVYEKNMVQVRGQLLQSGSKLVSDLSTNMAKKADELSVSIVGPFRRGPEKVSSFIARSVVKNPILVQKFISFFVAFLNRNFFGKTYVSNTFIVNGKIMNGAAYVLNKIGFKETSATLAKMAPTPGGLTSRVGSAFMASAMFYWLRVLENEELAGGGGNPNVGQEQKGMKTDAKIAANAAATTAAMAVQIAEKEKPEDGQQEPVGLGEAATQTAASLRKEAKKTTNPALKKYIDSVQKELDKLAKELQAAKDKEAKETAKKKAAAALAAQAAAVQKAARKKLQQTQQKSPSADKVPEKARKGAQEDTATAKGASSDATQQAARSSGLGGPGTGGGKGAGAGTGVGAGMRDDSAVWDFIDEYLKQRSAGDENTHDSVSSKLQNQLHKDVGDKLYKIYKELIEFNKDKSYDVLGRTLKKVPSLWLFGQALAYEKDNVFFKTRYIKDLDKDKALKFLNNVDVEKLKNYVIKESIEQYRNKVLNERYEKLLKGFTKEGK
jgi:HPt (histidine-containing phosphotransfer) domain-containing protein